MQPAQLRYGFIFKFKSRLPLVSDVLGSAAQAVGWISMITDNLKQRQWLLGGHQPYFQLSSWSVPQCFQTKTVNIHLFASLLYRDTQKKIELFCHFSIIYIKANLGKLGLLLLFLSKRIHQWEELKYKSLEQNLNWENSCILPTYLTRLSAISKTSIHQLNVFIQKHCIDLLIMHNYGLQCDNQM